MDATLGVRTSRLEKAVQQCKDREEIHSPLTNNSVSNETLASAIRLKERGAQVNVLIHAIGAWTVPPCIFEDADRVDE